MSCTIRSAIRTLIRLSLALTALPAWSSPPEDSLRSALTGQAPAGLKADALVNLAERAMAVDPPGALGYARNALAYAERSGDQKAELQALQVKADAETALGLYADALQTRFRALEISKVMGDPQAIARDLRALSDAYHFEGLLDRAVDEARNAVAILLPTNDEHTIAEAHADLVRCLRDAGRHDEAITVGNAALKRIESAGTMPVKATLWRQIGEVLLDQGRPTDALPMLTRAERELESGDSGSERFQVDLALARNHTLLGRFKEADQHIQKAERSTGSGLSFRQRDALRHARYQWALEQHQWEEAVRYLQAIKATDDSLDLARVKMKMVGMQVMHQLERRDEDNAKLLVRNVINEEAIADQRAYNRWLIVMSVVLFALALVLGFTMRHALRMNRRLKLKTEVIRRQSEEIGAKNLELQRQNMRLSESLVNEEEKEMLIKEIHHRVKNNLQVVDSLLTIQGSMHMDPALEKQFREAQGRIRSMALVHEHIYRSGGGQGGSLKSHLEQLARTVLVAYGLHDRVSVSVASPLDGFPEETQMPLTLMVNELLTNAVKHAFTGREHGHIRIVVRPAGEGYELLFSDDGQGLGQDGGYLRDRSFGMELVEILARQLNGEVRLLKGQGTTFSFSFVPDKKEIRAAS